MFSYNNQLYAIQKIFFLVYNEDRPSKMGGFNFLKNKI